jgi:regulator of RNase E activity RraA
MSTLSPEAREKLTHCSTATLTTLLFKRGLNRQFIQDVRPIGRYERSMVGEAFTLRTIPAREDLNPLSVFRDPDHPQRKAVEVCPAGHVLVIDSRKDARAASAGGILITRLMMRGVAGVVTDGGFRDTTDIAQLSMPAYQSRPAVPTNLSLHQPVEMNVPIACGDAPVFPGDIVVGDNEGVLVLPKEYAEDMAHEAFEMTIFEDFVLEQVQGGASIRGLYPATNPETEVAFQAWRTKNKR